MGTLMTSADRSWLQHTLMPSAGIKELRLVEDAEWAPEYPDLWMTVGPPIEVTVTRAWARQPMHERRKRLLHEVVCHGVYRWPHNDKMRRLGFYSQPSKDKLTMRIYREFVKTGKLKGAEPWQ